MEIRFTPVRMDQAYGLSVDGDVLTIQIGDQELDVFDFSGIPEGATLPRDAVACDWLASDVERAGGQIALTLILPHGANAPVETRFPAPVVATSGAVALPPYETLEEEEA